MAGLFIRVFHNCLQMDASLVIEAFTLQPCLHLLALLFLKADDRHVFFLACVLHADVVFVVVQAILEGGALQDLALHHDVKLRLRVLHHA